MVRDILTAAIAMQSDMIMVGGDERLEGDQDTGSDVVVMNDQESTCGAVLGAGAEKGIIAVCRDGRVAVLCKLIPDRRVVREISANTLVESIRELAM